MEVKTCSKCKQELRVSLFKSDSSKPSGLRSSCKLCCSQQYNKEKQENPTKFQKYRDNFRERNPDYFKDYMKEYRRLQAL